VTGKKRSNRPLADELPELLARRQLTLRGLARELAVDQAYLSRILGKGGKRRASKKIAAAIARAFDLPEDYFPDYRERVVTEAIALDPALRDRIYDSLKRRP
jgi:transcriptional regulator with XRE-family HTH domain